MLKIAVCDDEPAIIEQIEGYVSAACTKIPIPYSTKCFLSGEELMEQLQGGCFFDIIYLDISMKGISGIDVGKQLRERFCNNKTLLIFISSFEEKAKELFECNTYRFLIKPIEQVKFVEYFTSACQYLGVKEQKRLEFKEIKGEKEAVLFDDIVYLECSGRMILLVTFKRRYYFYGRMKEIVVFFKNDDFIRIHNSILVNYDYISMIRYDSVLLKNGETKDISGPKRKSVREVYAMIRRRREL